MYLLNGIPRVVEDKGNRLARLQLFGGERITVTERRTERKYCSMFLPNSIKRREVYRKMELVSGANKTEWCPKDREGLSSEIEIQGRERLNKIVYRYY